jgi:hypothetical protein
LGYTLSHGFFLGLSTSTGVLSNPSKYTRSPGIESFGGFNNSTLLPS